jgi:hypothetical protein
MSTLTLCIVIAFCIGYLCIALESVTKVNKAAIALLMCVFCWTLLMVDPFGYYPLRYQGRVLMVLPLMDDKISTMEVLLDYAGDYRLMLYRKGPNPDGVKKIEK